MSGFNRFADRLTDWWFRPKPWPKYLLTVGAPMVTWSGAAFALRGLDITVPDVISGTLLLDAAPAWVHPAVFGLGVLLCVVGLWLGTGEYMHDQRIRRRNSSRHRCVVIEIRGLRNGPATPLKDSVAESSGEPTIPIVIDVRDHLHDGQVVSPEAAVREVELGFAGLRAQLGQHDASDLSFVAGGLAPVPLTFLLGVLLDDERSVESLDWDRTAERWRVLDAADDGARFDTARSDSVTIGQPVCELTASARDGRADLCSVA